MKVLVLTMIMISSQAFAVGYKEMTTNFTVYSAIGNSSRAYYHCDTVEAQTESILKRLGAKNISAKCTGGISPWGGILLDAFVRVRFEALSNEVQGNMTTAIMNQRIDGQSCHLDNSIVDGVKRNFEISSLRARNCFRANDRTFITMDILKEIE